MRRQISIVTGWEERINWRRVGIQWWKGLTQSIIKIREKNGKTLTLMLPAGRQWNGASVPKPAHWYATPEEFLFESDWHDWGYQFHWFFCLDEATGEWRKMKVGKMWVDGLFHDLMRLRGTRVTKTDVVWAAVGLGGWLAWWKNTCNDDCEICPCNAGAWCTERKIDPPGAVPCPLLPFLLALGLLLSGGCAWSFSGKRTIDWTISAPGFSVGCKSAVDGQYQPINTTDLDAMTPEERADAMLPAIRQAIISASTKPPSADDER